MMLKDVVMWLSNIFGMEWYEYLSGSFFGIQYLYFWFNHIISISNGCIGELIHVAYLTIVYIISKAILVFL